jgi:hypothetical protein
MEGVLAPTRTAAEALIAESRAVTGTATEEITEMRTLLDFDRELALVVAAWDDRGSRSESAERFDALVAEAGEVALRARVLTAAGAACDGPQRNRVQWAGLVLQRTRQLRDLAVVADGTAYDALRMRFSAAPYGEDRVAADAESQVCWAEETSLLGAPERVASLLAGLEAALAG